MKINIKNNYLYIDEFKLKCAVGKGGIAKNKVEGDKCTPRGEYKLEYIYYRKDGVKKPISKIKSKIIFVKDRPGHDMRYALNSNKMKKKLNWKT